MQYDVFKTVLQSIRSLEVIESDVDLMVVMKGETVPVVMFDKKTGGLMFKPENFKSSRFEFGLLLNALSGVYTQGNDMMMNKVEVVDHVDDNVVAKVFKSGEIESIDPEKYSEDDIDLIVCKELMDRHSRDGIDPLVGVLAFCRYVERLEADETESRSIQEQSVDEKVKAEVSKI